MSKPGNGKDVVDTRREFWWEEKPSRRRHCGGQGTGGRELRTTRVGGGVKAKKGFVYRKKHNLVYTRKEMQPWVQKCNNAIN